jgi:hypothetical protein
MKQYINKSGDFFDIIQGGNFSSFDAEGFDAENAEDVQDFNRMKSMMRSNPSKMAAQLVAAKKTIQNNPIGGIQKGGINNGALLGSALKGVFKMNIQRIGITIANELPAVLFGSSDALTGYTKVLGASLPVGVSLVGFQNGMHVQINDKTDPKQLTFFDDAFANRDSVRFLYSDGTNADVIKITCDQNPYPIILDQSALDMMLVNGVRFKTANSANYAQLSASLKPFRRTTLGKSTDDSVNLDTFFSPNQFQQGTIDYEINTTLDKETSIVMQIIQAAFTLNASVFVNSRNEFNAIKASAKTSIR